MSISCSIAWISSNCRKSSAERVECPIVQIVFCSVSINSDDANIEPSSRRPGDRCTHQSCFAIIGMLFLAITIPHNESENTMKRFNQNRLHSQVAAARPSRQQPRPFETETDPEAPEQEPGRFPRRRRKHIYEIAFGI